MHDPCESSFLTYIIKDDTWTPTLNAPDNNELGVHLNESNEEDD
jgi:hypothetical protein